MNPIIILTVGLVLLQTPAASDPQIKGNVGHSVVQAFCSTMKYSQGVSDGAEKSFGGKSQG